MAAVFTWQQWGIRNEGIKMQESPLRWINRMLSKQTWIYLKCGETIEQEKVKTYSQFRFDEDTNKLYILPKEEEVQP